MNIDVRGIQASHFNCAVYEFFQVLGLLVRDRELFLPAFRRLVGIGQK